MDVIRFQPGETLTEILDLTASPEQVRSSSDDLDHLDSVFACFFLLNINNVKLFTISAQHVDVCAVFVQSEWKNTALPSGVKQV